MTSVDAHRTSSTKNFLATSTGCSRGGLNRLGPVTVAVSCLLLLASVEAADLLEATPQMAMYKLSNLRVEREIGGSIFVFDYRRTREGTGTPQLAARTDQGPCEIYGFGMIDKASGTMRLRDRFEHLRRIMNGAEGGNGIEFYFVSKRVPYGFGGKEYLISNPIRHGTMNTKLDARKPTAAEKAEAERQRLARIPPEKVPAGYIRATSSTRLVPGAPVKFGMIGQWKDAEVVAVDETQTARLFVPGSQTLRKIKVADWIALSEATQKAIQDSPDQFVCSVRALPDGSLILDDDMVPVVPLPAEINSIESLPPGVPLVAEQNSRWVNAYLMNIDQQRARVLINRPNRTRIEFIPLEQLAIRKQTMTDMKDDVIVAAYAENMATFENRAVRLPGEGGAMETVGIQQTAESKNPFESTLKEPAKKAELRTWSDTSGQFEVKGRLLSQDETQVVLQREDGKSISVPTELLSETDRKYLDDLMAPEDKNPFNNVIDSPAEAMTSEPSLRSDAVSALDIDFTRPMELKRTIGDLGWGAASVAVSPNNRFLLIGRKAACASLVDLRTGAVIVDSGRMDHMGDIGVCGFTPDGSKAVIGGARGVIEIYDLSDNGQMKLIQQFAPHQKPITSLSFSTDSRFALSGSEDKEARYWEVATGKQLAALSGFAGKIKATRITPDGKLFMATDGQTLQVYDIAAAKIVREAEVGRSWASGQSAAFSPNGLLLAVGDGHKFHVWNLVTFTELPILDGSQIGWSAVFCPDNRHFISGGNGVVNVWDVKTQTRVLSQPVGSSFYVQAVNISSDGSLIACPSAFKEVKVLKAAVR